MAGDDESLVARSNLSYVRRVYQNPSEGLFYINAAGHTVHRTVTQRSIHAPQRLPDCFVY